jgi:hypothetical protein
MPYYTEKEENGQVAVWFGLSPEEPELDINREFIAWCDTPINAQKLIDRTQQADRLDNSYGVVIWGINDVVDKFGVTRQEAADYLAGIASRLEEAQTERGWQVIDWCRDELADGRTKEERRAWAREQEDYTGEEEEHDDEALVSPSAAA